MMSPEQVTAMIKEALGAAQAEMHAESEKFQKSLEKQFGSVENAKAAGEQTNFAAKADASLAATLEDQPKASVGRIVRALAGARGNLDAAIYYASQAGEKELASALSKSKANAGEKAMTFGGFDSGGSLVPPEFSKEVIGLLYPQLTISQLGARVLQMPRGTMTIPFMDSGASASYIGETQNIPASQPATGAMSLVAKKLAAIVPISNDLLNIKDVGADQFVQEDILERLRVRADQAFYNGTGASGEPVGVRNHAVAANVFSASGTSHQDKVNDLLRLQKRVRDHNIAVPAGQGGYILDLAIEHNLLASLDASGNRAFPSMDVGMLLGQPVRASTSANAGEIMFGAFRNVIIGEVGSIQVTVHPDGAYHDGSGVVSGVSNDTTPVRAIMRHDLGCRYRGKEIAVATNVSWTLS